MTITWKGSRSFQRQDQSLLIINYYQVQSFYLHKPIYGIQISAYTDHSPHIIHTEMIEHISYSSSHTNNLIALCIEYHVTPTDFFSALDTLMDMVAE